jgi:hypothetical protein
MKDSRLLPNDPYSTATSDPLLTLLETANDLRCSKAHISNLINGKVSGVPVLPTIALGRRKLVRRSTLEHWKAMCEADCDAKLSSHVSLDDAVNA